MRRYRFVVAAAIVFAAVFGTVGAAYTGTVLTTHATTNTHQACFTHVHDTVTVATARHLTHRSTHDTGLGGVQYTS